MLFLKWLQYSKYTEFLICWIDYFRLVDGIIGYSLQSDLHLKQQKIPIMTFNIFSLNYVVWLQVLWNNWKAIFLLERFLDQPASPRAMQRTSLLLTCFFQLLFSFGDIFQLTLYVLNLWQVDSRTWKFLSSWEQFLLFLLLCWSRNILHKRTPVTFLLQ